MNNAVRLTALSTLDWPAWWANERVRSQTDWPSLLRQHERVFQQLCELRGTSS
jgi:hypothetical protein